MSESSAHRTWVPYRPEYAHVPTTRHAGYAVRPLDPRVAPPAHVTDAERTAERITEPLTVRLWNAWYAVKYACHWGSTCPHTHWAGGWRIIRLGARLARRCVTCGHTVLRRREERS